MLNLTHITDRYIGGDNDALAELYVAMKDRLLLVAYHKCHDAELCRDVVQDVFERLVQLSPEKRRLYFGAGQGNMQAFLYVAVRNRCADVKKIGHNREKIFQSIRHLFTGQSKNQSREKFCQDGLREMLNSLQPKEQQIIRLHLEGYSNEEIASSLQLTYNTVKNNIYEARKKIRGLWEIFMT